MSRYELVVVLKAGDKDVKKRVDTLVKENGFKMEAEEALGLKTLEYKIKGQESADYFKLILDGEGSGIKKLEGAFNIEAGVLRYLTIALTEKLEKTRAAMEVARAELKAKREDAEGKSA